MQRLGPNRRRATTLTALVALLLACLIPFGGSASGADQVITHTFSAVQCQATLNGSQIVQSQDVTVGFLVPDQVAPGQTFTVTFPGESALLPSASNGLTITAYSNLSLSYQVVGATFVAGSIVNPGNCKPGNGYGDKNHCHSGPPGMTRACTTAATSSAPATARSITMRRRASTTPGLSSLGLYGLRRRLAARELTS